MPNITVNTDLVGRNRAAALLPIVQVTVPAATLDYVYNGAAGFGLIRVASSATNRVLSAGDLTPTVRAGVLGTTFDLDAEKTAIALVKATALGMTTEEVVSAALATGLALLSGVDAGPYTADGVSRQFLPPVIP